MPSVHLKLGLAALLVLPIFGRAAAAPASAYAELDRRSAAACIKAAALKDSRVGSAVRFSDPTGYDARVVTGRWPQPHMKNAPARMLCLYERRTGRAEVQELAL